MTFDSNKSYAIGVWDMTFYVIDTETDEPMRNKDGTVKLFRSDNYDLSYLADGLDVDDLKEAEPIVHLYKGELIK
jgi:hypothetical protein